MDHKTKTTSEAFEDLDNALKKVGKAILESRICIFWLGILVGMLLGWAIEDLLNLLRGQ